MPLADRFERLSGPRQHTLSITGWPTTFNALAWSNDSTLAIALDDYIELLIPKIELAHLTADRNPFGPLRANANTSNGAKATSSSRARQSPELEHWHRLRLQTNVFTVAEWPYVEPQRFSDFDVGEEQGTAGVVALEWSNEGLGRFGRCVLGVLTANGVLSIWADGGRVREEGGMGWKRRLVVWGVLRREFRGRIGMDGDGYGDARTSENEVKTETEGAAEHVEHARLSAILHKRCRVRSFCWTQVPQDTTHLSKRLRKRAVRKGTNHLLFVTNDYEEIIVLHVRSPYDSRQARSDWDIKVLSVIDTKSEGVQDTGKPQLFSLKRGLHSVSVSEWTTVQGQEQVSTAFVAYGMDHNLEVMKCKISYDGVEIVLKADRESVLNLSNHDVVGPLRWAAKRNVEDMDVLYASCRGFIINLAFHHAEFPTRYLAGKTQARDNWSSIAGLTLTHNKAPGHHKLHYSPHILTFKDTSAKCEIWSISSIDDLTPEAAWLNALYTHGEEFADAYGLFEHIEQRVWGMASAPNQRHIAVCYSLHPSDLIHYVMPAQQTSFVSFSDETKEQVPEVELGISAESNLFHFSTWLRGRDEEAAEPQNRLLRLRDSLHGFFTIGPLSLDLAGAPGQPDTAENHSRRDSSGSCVEIYESGDVQSFVLALRSSMCRPERLYIRLLKGIDAVIAGNRFGKISGYAGDNEQKIDILEFISVAMDKLTKQTTISNMIRAMWESAAELPYIDASGWLPGTIKHYSQEQCELCNSPITFESTEEARCQSGHLFTRCALTLLTIQEPGVSKFCGICNAQYYQEDVLLARERQQPELPNRSHDDVNTNTKLHDISLTQVLFLAADRCLFCGGKFVT